MALLICTLLSRTLASVCFLETGYFRFHILAPQIDALELSLRSLYKSVIDFCSLFIIHGPRVGARRLRSQFYGNQCGSTGLHTPIKAPEFRHQSSTGAHSSHRILLANLNKTTASARNRLVHGGREIKVRGLLGN